MRVGWKIAMTYLVFFAVAIPVRLTVAASRGPTGNNEKICARYLQRFNGLKISIRQWLWDAMNPGEVAPWILIKDSEEKKAEFDRIKTSFEAMDDSRTKVRFAVEEGRKVGVGLYFLKRRSRRSEFQTYQSIFLRQQLLMYCNYLVDVYMRIHMKTLAFDIPTIESTEIANVGEDYCTEIGFWFAKE